MPRLSTLYVVPVHVGLISFCDVYLPMPLRLRFTYSSTFVCVCVRVPSIVCIWSSCYYVFMTSLLTPYVTFDVMAPIVAGIIVNRIARLVKHAKCCIIHWHALRFSTKGNALPNLRNLPRTTSSFFGCPCQVVRVAISTASV